MGLSERKSKQRIGPDPRNLAWRQDTNSFGAQFLLKAGHTPNTALGLTPSNGLINPIAVARKLDNSGIGVGRARREGGTEGSGAGLAGTGLEDVLRRLRGEGSSSDGSSQVLGGFARAGADDLQDTVVVRDGAAAAPSPPVAAADKPRRMAHRQRNLAAKKLASASASPLAMAEILGIKSESPSAFASPAPSPLGTPITSLDEPNELITSAKISVGDYFQQRMAEKKRLAAEAIAAAAAASAAPQGGMPAPEVGEEEIVVVGGGAPAVALTVEEPVASTSAASETPKEALSAAQDRKRARKEKKEKKQGKRARTEEVEEEEEVVAELEVPIAAASAPLPEVLVQAGSDDVKVKKEKRDKKDKKDKKKKEKMDRDGSSKKKKRRTE